MTTIFKKRLSFFFFLPLELGLFLGVFKQVSLCVCLRIYMLMPLSHSTDIRVILHKLVQIMLSYVTSL